ncbi:MAG: ABC-F family ATP-binding cassette domain-containing protein, partial [Deltaproteobacteria bacterium]|nr:ABC-F family ATP-binding cassette domain-containing protein [Deltaproteobacteria bacterium]
MSLLQLDSVSFSFAGRDPLFESVTFSVAAGERLALVAPNGVGKSTLPKIVAGDLEPTEGRLIRRRELRLGYLRQSHEPRLAGDVMSALLEPFREALSIRDELRRALEAGDLERIEETQARYEAASGYDIERRAGRLATELGLTDADLGRPVSSLSGGERGRLALATVLTSEPELLLLDEPTNHLDLDATLRLETLLLGSPAGVIVVSHDRAFLEATCPRIAELGEGGARLFVGPYSRYEIEREKLREKETAAFERQKDEIARTEDFIRRNIAGQKTKQAQSRRKALAKVERLARPEDEWRDAGRIGLGFAPAPRTGDIVLDAQGLGAARGGRRLYEGLDLLVRRGERLAIVGPNGAGKTTLLRALAGRDEPDEGTLRHGTNVVLAVMDQHLEALDPGRSMIEEIQTVRGDMSTDRVREYLARFRFFGEEPFRVIEGLSGGEHARLALAKMLLVPRNLLFLDEPTNHLDIPACEVLERALARFEGTIVLVSHDRALIDHVATRILWLGERGVIAMAGNWSTLKGHLDGRSGGPASTGRRKFGHGLGEQSAPRARRADDAYRRVLGGGATTPSGSRAGQTVARLPPAGTS